MASDYPSSIDSFPDPLANSPLNAPSHSALHQDVNDAVEKIEVKLGVNTSPASGASNGKVLMADGSGGSDWSNIGAGNIKTEGAAAGAVLVSDGVDSGAFSAQPVGLWKIGDYVVASPSTEIVIDNIFTSAYTNYKIVMSLNTVGSSNWAWLQYLNSSGVAIGSGYIAAFYAQDIGTSGSFGFFGQQRNVVAPLGFTYFDSTIQTGFEITIYNPVGTGATMHNGQFTGIEAGVRWAAGTTYGVNNASPNARGLRIGNNLGTALTGKISVYGYL